MINLGASIPELIEAFVLGCSCFLGGDQYFIMMTQSPVSPKSQYYVTLTVIVVTFTVTMYMNGTSPALFNGSQLLYSFSLPILISILYQNINSVWVPYLLYHFLAFVLTFLVIQSSAYYSKNKNLLLSFILGLFASRLMPTFCWTLMTKKAMDKDTNLHKLAFFLVLLHWSLALGSLMIRITQGTLSFLYIGHSEPKDEGDIYEPIDITFYLNLFAKQRVNLFPFLFFVLSIAIFIGFPPTVTKLYFNYSSHLNSYLSILEIAFHLLGSSLGILFPSSRGCVYPSFYVVNGVIFYFYIYCTTSTKVFLKFFSHKTMFLRVMLASLAIGYNWSYNLGVFLGYITGKTCKCDEIARSPCCGYKIETQCYCRLPYIIEDLNKGPTTCNIYIVCFKYFFIFKGICNYPNRFSCSKSFTSKEWNESFNYYRDAPNAILLLHNGTDCSKISCCTNQCNSVCSSGKCLCLRLIGIYKIESVTTSTCENCQLTIRIEAKSTCCCKNGSCSGSVGSCHCNGEPNKCCCLSVKCCEPSCPQGNCCCVKFCCCQSCVSCLCKNANKLNMTRLFICFNNGDKCCIKEIRPNFKKEFIPDLKIQNEFDIKSIFFSDCCHTDLAVNIGCSMKNNFFRLTSINYPKKTNEPLSLTLMRDGIECCKEKPPKCCCKNNKFVKVCVKYDGSEENCQIKCTCQGTDRTCCCGQGTNCCCCSADGKCCCCITCDLNIDEMSSFYMKVEPVKIKLSCISIFFIVFLSMLFVYIVVSIREKTIPPYIFSYTTTLDSLNKVVNSRGLNSDDLICKRIQYAVTSHDSIYIRPADTENLIGLFDKVLGRKSFEKLRRQIASLSNRFIASPLVEAKKKKIEMVRWCYATGFIYAYFVIVFKSIQKFFAYWEEAWNNEFKDYRKFLTPTINKISLKSKFALSLLTEAEVNEKGIMYVNNSRTTSWNDVLNELSMFSELFTEENQTTGQNIPYRLDLRFERYLERWDHRLIHIQAWTTTERSVYDWKPFVCGLRLYRSWFKDFQRYLTLFSFNVRLPDKELEKHTEVFLAKQIK